MGRGFNPPLGILIVGTPPPIPKPLPQARSFNPPLGILIVGTGVPGEHPGSSGPVSIPRSGF